VICPVNSADRRNAMAYLAHQSIFAYKRDQVT
jgi:hypothetical protein